MSLLALALIQTATVYTRGPDGTFSDIAQSGLPVRLISPSAEGSATERAELAATRRLLWGPGYELPDGCEVEVDGARWTAVRGTHALLLGPSGAPHHRRCEVVRADA